MFIGKAIKIWRQFRDAKRRKKERERAWSDRLWYYFTPPITLDADEIDLKTIEVVTVIPLLLRVKRLENVQGVFEWEGDDVH